jgi:DNA polymerase V
MYALVDCNNFYASCERLFQPKLQGCPVVVLSNNDGCVIARSDEAKALGIVMGTPAYMNEALFRKNNVAVFSSNYTLYGDMSNRVMKTLSGFVPRMELYSIDEAFLDMSELKYADLHKLGIDIKTTVTRNTGIPVSVGIAPTKALAKMANRYAKKRFKEVGVFYAANQWLIDEMLDFTEVGDIWGVGRQYALMLKRNGFHTAKDFININADWIRTNMSVVGLRLWNELRGVPSIEWEFEPKAKQNICTSRSFGKLTNDYSILKEAVSNYAAACAEKLRKQQSVCKQVNVFISTNPHKADQQQYKHSITIQCETATDSSSEIIAYALKGLEIIFKPGYLFMKCGVMVLNIIPEAEVQMNLFDTKDRTKDKKALSAMDSINQLYGGGTVRMAVQRFDRRFRLRADHLSKRYTTRFNEVLNVKI